MTDDLQSIIRAQADEDVAAFIASLDEDTGSGVPPPPKIEISEVETNPVELEFVPFGTQGADTTPSGYGGGVPPPPSEVLWACCLPDGTCTDTTEPDCVSMDGVWHEGQSCDDPEDPCPLGACCYTDGNCIEETEVQCGSDGGTYQGDGTGCSPNPCPLPCCEGCSFSAFDGSGRKFHTLTTETTGTINDSTGGWSVTFNSTKTESCPGPSCSCSGSGSSSDGCTADFDVCLFGSPSSFPEVGGCHLNEHFDCCGTCVLVGQNSGDSGCAGEVTSTTATEQVTTWDCSGFGGARISNATVTATLSDECDDLC